MTVSVSPAAGSWVLQTSSATQTHSFALAARPSANAIPVVGWIDRTGSLTVDAVSDATNGAWTILVNTTLSGNRFIVATPTSGNALPTSANVHTTGVGNSQMLAGWVNSDVQLVTVSGTPTSVNDTNSDTGTVSASVTLTGRGGVISFIYAPSAQSANPTMNGGESSLKNGEAGLRILGVFEAQAAAGTYSTDTTLATASTTSIITIGFTDESVGPDPPTITDVDEDNTVTLEQANVEIDGTDFDTATVDIEQGAEVYSASIDSQNATAIVFDMPSVAGAAPKHGAATVRVTNTDDQDDTQAITIAAEAGSDYVDVGTPNVDTDLWIADFDPDVVSGDQVQWRVTQIGFDETDVEINDDLTGDFTEGLESFEHRAWDSGDSTWGAWLEQPLVDDEEVPAPSPTVSADVTGGWSIFFRFEQERERRRRRKREEEEAAEAAEKLPEVDRQISEFLRKQEAEDARRTEIDRLRALVNEYRGKSLPLSDRGKAAFDRAAERQSISSLLKLEKELRRQQDDEMAAIVMFLLND